MQQAGKHKFGIVADALAVKAGKQRVGAISFDVTQHEAASKAAQEIVAELRASRR